MASLDELRAWKEKGVKRDVARHYIDHGISLDAARKWIDSDIPDDDAALACSAGLTLDEAERWIALGIDIPEYLVMSDDNITYEMVKEFVNAGFSGNDTKYWLYKNRDGYFIDTEQAIEWRDAGFSSEDAYNWLRFGIDETKDAKEWVALLNDISIMPHAWVIRPIYELTQIGVYPEDARRWVDGGIHLANIHHYVENNASLRDAVKWESAGYDASEYARSKSKLEFLELNKKKVTELAEGLVRNLVFGICNVKLVGDGGPVDGSIKLAYEYRDKLNTIVDSLFKELDGDIEKVNIS